MLVLGDEIRRLRADRKQSQEDLAYDVGIDKKTLAQMERGGPSFPGNVHRVAEILGVPFDHLLHPDSFPSARKLAKDRSPTIICELEVDESTVDPNSPESVARYVERLVDRLGNKCPIIVLNLRRGSVIITIELRAKNVPHLIRVFANRKLDDLGVMALRLPTTKQLGKALDSYALNLFHAIRGGWLKEWKELWAGVFFGGSLATGPGGRYTPDVSALLSLLVRHRSQAVSVSWDEPGIVSLRRIQN